MRTKYSLKIYKTYDLYTIQSMFAMTIYKST